MGGEEMRGVEGEREGGGGRWDRIGLGLGRDSGIE